MKIALFLNTEISSKLGNNLIYVLVFAVENKKLVEIRNYILNKNDSISIVIWSVYNQIKEIYVTQIIDCITSQIFEEQGISIKNMATIKDSELFNAIL